MLAPFCRDRSPPIYAVSQLPPVVRTLGPTTTVAHPCTCIWNPKAFLPNVQNIAEQWHKAWLPLDQWHPRVFFLFHRPMRPSEVLVGKKPLTNVVCGKLLEAQVILFGFGFFFRRKSCQDLKSLRSHGNFPDLYFFSKWTLFSILFAHLNLCYHHISLWEKFRCSDSFCSQSQSVTNSRKPSGERRRSKRAVIYAKQCVYT